MTLNPFLTRGKKVKEPVAKDPQRHLVYGMERNDLIGLACNTVSPMSHLEAVAKNACNLFGVPPLKVQTYSDHDEKVFGHCYVNRITLNRAYHGANVHTLLHELAHYIDWRIHYGEPQQPDHGPRFMGYYIYLMDKYKMIPAYAFKAICDKWGIKYDETEL